MHRYQCIGGAVGIDERLDSRQVVELINIVHGNYPEGDGPVIIVGHVVSCLVGHLCNFVGPVRSATSHCCRYLQENGRKETVFVWDYLKLPFLSFPFLSY